MERERPYRGADVESQVLQENLLPTAAEMGTTVRGENDQQSAVSSWIRRHTSGLFDCCTPSSTIPAFSFQKAEVQVPCRTLSDRRTATQHYNRKSTALREPD